MPMPKRITELPNKEYAKFLTVYVPLTKTPSDFNFL